MKRALILLAVALALVAAGYFGVRQYQSWQRERDLDLVQESCFRFFWENCHPKLGLVLDRQNNFLPSALTYSPSSVASVGFGLASLPVAVERGWVTRAAAEERALVTLKTMRDIVPHEHGFWYHFVDPLTGARSWNSELSSIDSVLFLAGALTAGSYFGGEVDRIATQLYDRVDWPWMLNGEKTFSMGWKPDKGFLPQRWERYDEASILYILAIGSRTHPVPVDCWKAVTREIGEYKGHVCLVSPPLFTHQFSHLFVDFRDKNDGFADYWKSSVEATLANRQFCIDESAKFRTYAPDLWGLTACDAPAGYKAYGAPPGKAIHDGTIAPTGALGCFQFTPTESYRVLRRLLSIDGLWGRYGFSDAVNLDQTFRGRPWIATDAIGIDQGAILLSIENARSGRVWRLFSDRPEIQAALAKIGFKPGTIAMKPTVSQSPALSQRLATKPSVPIPFAAVPPFVDGQVDEPWLNSNAIRLDSATLESGESDNDSDISSNIHLLWDQHALYIFAEVADDEIVATRSGADIYTEDCIEIYIDPQNNLLEWGSPFDFQVGLAPTDSGTVWAWFQKLDPRSEGVEVAHRKVPGGYLFEVAIPWAFLKVAPSPGMKFGFSVSLNDADKQGSRSAKHSWFFLDPGIHLGEARLEK